MKAAPKTPPRLPHPDAEWLETDGLGGFACGTTSGIRTRREHGLLASMLPSERRVMLVNGFDASIETTAGRFAISSHRYHPDVVSPDVAGRLIAFDHRPWPRWRFRLEDGTVVDQELFMRQGARVAVLTWRLVRRGRGALLTLRPLISGRDVSAIHRENASFRFDAQVRGQRIAWQPYPGMPTIAAWSNGSYAHEPVWYRGFRYTRDAGASEPEDLASPGRFRWDLESAEAVWILCAADAADELFLADLSTRRYAEKLRRAEARRRAAQPSELHRSAEAYVIRRGDRPAIIAGYPWLLDWARDTFIAVRGLCLATGRLEEAGSILIEWTKHVRDGRLPTRLPASREMGRPAAIDAELWFVIAVSEWFAAAKARGMRIGRRDHVRLWGAVEAIMNACADGSREDVRIDEDGLLDVGPAEQSPTWMDAQVDGRAVTPRLGKPVEIQALWLNAARIASRFSSRWDLLFIQGCQSFRSKFWNPSAGCLYDVVDAGQQPGMVDTVCRPNQIFAVGGLPFALLDGERARQVVDTVERRLITPMGPRTLAEHEPGYQSRIHGDRHGAATYHQGAIWPWLIGPFVEAWVRVRGETADARRQARARFLDPLLELAASCGLGHVPQMADGGEPHTPRGCPFQAWSVAEALRVSLTVLADRPTPAPAVVPDAAVTVD